jgi:transcriptional regulator with XRE-family HTH domain
MAETTLADRLQRIISEQKLTVASFAKSLGRSRSNISQLVNGRLTTCSFTTALMIEKVYGYPADWVMTGNIPPGKLSQEMAHKILGMDESKLRDVAAYIKSLEEGGGE